VLILSCDRIIQWRLPAVAGSASIDVGAVADQYFGCSLVRRRIAATAGRTAHSDGVKRRRSYNGV
jgi:hypothetical protein